jgi:flagellar biosynthesis/type III secretory pathway M-ring protein FliF/YscJ
MVAVAIGITFLSLFALGILQNASGHTSPTQAPSQYPTPAQSSNNGWELYAAIGGVVAAIAVIALLYMFIFRKGGGKAEPEAGEKREAAPADEEEKETETPEKEEEPTESEQEPASKDWSEENEPSSKREMEPSEESEKEIEG